MVRLLFNHIEFTLQSKTMFVKSVIKLIRIYLQIWWWISKGATWQPV